LFTTQVGQPTPGDYAVAAAQARESRPTWIVPVPLHPQRLRKRGFNVRLALTQQPQTFAVVLAAAAAVSF